jgi:hypothetical protein
MEDNENYIFPDDVSVTYNDRQKSFIVKNTKINRNQINAILNTIVENAQRERFQQYQMRMDEYDGPINTDIINFITDTDEQFYEFTRPVSQSYLDCYTCESLGDDSEFIEWKYTASSRVAKKRKDYSNAKINDLAYNLHKLKDIIIDEDKINKIDEMVHGGVISKDDIGTLKAITKIENIDVSYLEFPDFSDDEEE